MMANGTFFASANGYNKNAITIVRVSGPKVKKLLKQLCKIKIHPEVINYASVFKENGMLIDKCVILFFKKPKSSTGEDLVEFHLHGSRAIIKSLEETLLNIKGIYRAERGDFTKQAFFNNKLDLVQAEGLNDLINAETETQKQLAQNSLLGGVSRNINSWRNSLINLSSLLESLIDFSDEEIPKDTSDKFDCELKNLLNDIQVALDENKVAKIIREGLKVAIVGPPNAGKSSLINKIFKQELSIVDSEKGTTRDVISATIDLDGIQTTFYDTAGLHKSDKKVEQIGINKANRLAKNCDILLRLVDGSKNNWQTELKKLPYTGNAQINVINKSDLFLKQDGTKQTFLDMTIISSKTSIS